MENVTGITSVGRAVTANHRRQRNWVIKSRRKSCGPEEYGVPQERRRIFFVGNRLGLPILWPDQSHGPGLQPFVTVWDAIGDLPLNAVKYRAAQAYRHAPEGDFQRYVRGNQTHPDILRHGTGSQSENG